MHVVMINGKTTELQTKSIGRLEFKTVVLMAAVTTPWSKFKYKDIITDVKNLKNVIARSTITNFLLKKYFYSYDYELYLTM